MNVRILYLLFIGDLCSPARSSGPSHSPNAERAEKEVHRVSVGKTGQGRGLQPAG